MDDTKIQEILDSLPPRVLRSRLEPYTKLIHEMRQRGFTYRAIAEVLTEKCQVTVNPGSIHDFVRVRSKTRAKIAKKEPESSPAKSAQNLRNEPPPEEDDKPFFYDETKPLKLIPTKKPTE